MPYNRPYPGGFVDFPSTSTPIDASALNTMDVGIKTANDQFQTVTTAQRAALVPTVGQAVWDSDLKQVMVYMNASGGNAWQPVGNRIVCASTTRPSSPFEGQEIYETDSHRTLVYNGTSWVQVGDLDNTGGLSDAGLAQTVRVFTNEAARDAAITAPSEGMIAYLTAPTVPAATGGTTALPTGICTIYNGSVWVCVTPVSAYTQNTGTTTSATYTATLSGSPGTNPSVTLVTGTTALVSLTALLSTNTVGNGAVVSVAVSGAGTVAASDDFWAVTTTTQTIQCSRNVMLTGLTAGTNTFTLQYKNGTAGITTTAGYRGITVQGIA